MNIYIENGMLLCINNDAVYVQGFAKVFFFFLTLIDFFFRKKPSPKQSLLKSKVSNKYVNDFKKCRLPILSKTK